MSPQSKGGGGTALSLLKLPGTVTRCCACHFWYEGQDLRMRLGEENFLLCSGQDAGKRECRGQQTINQVRLH